MHQERLHPLAARGLLVTFLHTSQRKVNRLPVREPTFKTAIIAARYTSIFGQWLNFSDPSSGPTKCKKHKLAHDFGANQSSLHHIAPTKAHYMILGLSFFQFLIKSHHDRNASYWCINSIMHQYETLSRQYTSFILLIYLEPKLAQNVHWVFQ